MKVTFCGHADAHLLEKELKILENSVVEIVKQNQNCQFYLGGYGNFDFLCYELLTKIKEKYNGIERIFVTPYIADNYSKLKDNAKIYDSVIYPEIENCPLKFAIERRNKWMIKNADIVICFVNRNYGGAYKTLQYAKSQKKEYINVAEK